MRQNCETLNNILLAEFDYFSEVMVDDFEEMMSSFLLEQANLHRQARLTNTLPLMTCLFVCLFVCLLV